MTDLGLTDVLKKWIKILPYHEKCLILCNPYNRWALKDRGIAQLV